MSFSLLVHHESESPKDNVSLLIDGNYSVSKAKFTAASA
jgi:hypothetical protein